MTVRLLQGDCCEVMATLDAESIDAIVTDPPYGLEFMGKDWDRLATPKPGNIGGFADGNKPSFERVKRHLPAMQQWHESWTREAYRVLKPGAHLVAFGGSRTIHRLTSAIEDAGFEIRDQLVWLHGQGFPKNLNVSAALENRIPADSRCTCAPHSSRTVVDSLFDYPDYPRSDDAQPPAGSRAAQDAAPLPNGARGRSRGDQPVDALASSQASTSPDADTGHLSIADSRRQHAHLLAGSPGSGSTPSGTPLNTLPDDSMVMHRTALDISDTSRSGDDSASSQHILGSGHSNLPHCTTCGRVVIPQGLGTALKPAMELIILARKPLIGTVATNVERYGTGALNIDGCRIGTDERTNGGMASLGVMHDDAWRPRDVSHTVVGRWPANVALDEDAAAMLDATVGERRSPRPYIRGGGSDSKAVYGMYRNRDGEVNGSYGDTGGPSRFFYCAKASRSERNAGLEGRYQEGIEKRTTDDGRRIPIDNPFLRGETKRNNHHPTVKPVALMRWLVRLVTPPGGIVLDPFLGSGTTGIACVHEGFQFIGIEQEPEYVEIARRRIAHAEGPLFANVLS